MSRARAVRSLVVAAGFALAAAITAAVPAAASAAPNAEPAAVAQPAIITVPHFTAVPPNGRVSCYGYYGTFKTGTNVMVVDWVYSSNECFGIATDGTVWHAWQNGGGWKRMPGNIIAEDVVDCENEGSNGSKGVWVRKAGLRYVQRYALPLGWTGEWTTQ